jgi:hypothetical protein
MAEEQIKQLEQEMVGETEQKPETIKFEDPDSGEVWEGSPEEVASKLFESKRHANQVIRTQKEDNSFLRQTIDSYGLGNKDKVPKEEQFDKNKFFTEFATDPERAMRVMVSRALGVDDPAKMTEAVNSLKEDMEHYRTNRQISDFYSHIGADATGLGAEEIDLIKKELSNDSSLPNNALGLELAYRRLQAKGSLGGREQPQRARPPARLTGSGDRGQQYSDDDLNSMSMDKLKKIAGIGQ